MDAFAVFGIQTLFSFVVFTALTFIHALRPIGGTVLVASVAGTALPRDFADEVAYGDLVTSLLAVITPVVVVGPEIARRYKRSPAVHVAYVHSTMRYVREGQAEYEARVPGGAIISSSARRSR